MTSNAIIRVMVVEDHNILRGALVTVIDTCSDMQVVGQAANGVEALELYSQLQPDVVLMDLEMPVMDGPTTIRQLRESFPDPRVIVLTNFLDEKRLDEVLGAGALSYLLKNVSVHELRAAIREAYKGKRVLTQEATRMLVAKLRQPPSVDFQLTRAEKPILALLVQGLSNKEIAAELVSSVSTVKHHVSNILAKLKVSSRTAVIALAKQYKLLD